MKSTTAPVVTAIRSEHEVTALPKLLAEWNMNRYTTPTATNVPDELDEGFDIEMFPIESIIEPIRPLKGVSKGFIQQGMVADNYQTAREPRFHVASIDDKYKYWVAPYLSNSAGGISGANPQVIYNRTVSVNKISITVENSWATPTAYQVQVTTNGGAAWTNAGAPPVDNYGRIVLWWTGSGWANTQPAELGPTTTINGIRLVVTQLGAGRKTDGSIVTYRSPATGSYTNTNGALSFFSLIEISARLVMDLTSRVISTNDNFDAGEVNHLTPIGTATSNDGQITLWNGPDAFGAGTNMFSQKNVASPLFGLIESNVEFNLSYVYDIAPLKHTVQQFRMYSDEWADSNESTVTVSLSDASKYLKEVKPLPAKYENQTLAQIVYRLCDSVGFSDYNIFDNPNTIDYNIPVWWTDGEQTLWEIFDDLGKATQSVIYFDAWGRLNVKTREDAFNRASTPVWTLRGAKSGTELPDIIDLQQTDTFEANVVKVVYKSTKWADEVNGFPEFTTVWSPEDTATLRSSPLLNQLNPGETYLKIAPAEAAIWPYKGLCQIQGETIAYEGKMFNYRDGGVFKNRAILDQSEFDKYNAKASSATRMLNHFDGRLKIKERGMWNTEEVTHRVDASGYDVRRFGPSDVVSSNAGFTHNKQRSTVTMSSGGRLNGPVDFMCATRGSQSDSGWRHFGTRIKFDSGNHVDQRAGIVFNTVGNRGGYYVELCPTSTLTTKERQARKEVTFYTITGTQPNTRIPAKGSTAMIVEDRWHNLDIYYGWDNQRVAIWVDGKKHIDINVPAGQQFAPNGKFGLFIRGRTEAEFEYLYAIARQDEPVPEDDFSSLWALDGWHTGLTLKREWVWKERRRKRRIKKKLRNVKYRKNFQFMDEFGPYVHEVREFDVKFEPAPVQYSKPYSNNDDQAIFVDYRADAFGARFTMANAVRRNAVIHGDDSLTNPGVEGSIMNRQLLIYGRALVVGDDEEVVVRNESQIRARGEITTELTSDWIQTKEAAEALGKWITAHWGATTDQLSVEVFGNPLFEIGDLVAVEYPAKSMTAATHQYFVTGITTAFSSGLSTSLTLQRKN